MSDQNKNTKIIFAKYWKKVASCESHWKVLLNCFHLNGYIKEICQKTTGQLHLMSRRPCWYCTKKILRGMNSCLWKKILLFQEICMAADHVIENDLLNDTIGTTAQFFSQHKISSSNSKVKKENFYRTYLFNFGSKKKGYKKEGPGPS